MAETLGHEGRAERYHETAVRIGDAVDRHFFAGPGRFATHLTISGKEHADNVAFSAAVHPAGWAADYGHTDALVDAFLDSYERTETYWLPKEFTLAATLYAVGRTEAGDALLTELQAETLPGGTLAEEVDADGQHRFAALGWANAGFVHALHVREGIADWESAPIRGSPPNP
jgi:GH15 family glucan-1,4-alpha-glucosidase